MTGFLIMQNFLAVLGEPYQQKIHAFAQTVELHQRGALVKSQPESDLDAKRHDVASRVQASSAGTQSFGSVLQISGPVKQSG